MLPFLLVVHHLHVKTMPELSPTPEVGLCAKVTTVATIRKEREKSRVLVVETCVLALAHVTITPVLLKADPVAVFAQEQIRARTIKQVRRLVVEMVTCARGMTLAHPTKAQLKIEGQGVYVPITMFAKIIKGQSVQLVTLVKAQTHAITFQVASPSLVDVTMKMIVLSLIATAARVMHVQTPMETVGGVLVKPQTPRHGGRTG